MKTYYKLTVIRGTPNNLGYEIFNENFDTKANAVKTATTICKGLAAKKYGLYADGLRGKINFVHMHAGRIRQRVELVCPDDHSILAFYDAVVSPQHLRTSPVSHRGLRKCSYELGCV